MATQQMNIQNSPEATLQPQYFPFIPPGDSIVKNEINISKKIENISMNPEATKFCGVCDYPMTVKIVLVIFCNETFKYELYRFLATIICVTAAIV